MKNQCRCGCCWAFAAVEQIESDAIRTKNWSVNSPLSTAQACECTYSPYNLNGCDGGWPDDAYDYVKFVGGIQPEVIRPFNSTYYCGMSPYCSATNCPAIACGAAASSSYEVKVSNYYYTPTDEPSIASYVQNTGPVQVFVDASNWHTYISGTVTVCPNDGIDHTVQAVGIDTVAGYWKLRNSWGSNWGEAGYIRLAYNQNMCNIGLTGATYTAVALSKAPTAGPTTKPTRLPTNSPSRLPSRAPSNRPTTKPTRSPSRLPSRAPSTRPTTKPTQSPSRLPSRAPSTRPSTKPTQSPSRLPST